MPCGPNSDIRVSQVVECRRALRLSNPGLTRRNSVVQDLNPALCYRLRAAGGPRRIVIDQHASGAVDDFDAESVHTISTRPIAIDDGQQEAVASIAVHFSRTLQLGGRPCNSELIVRGALEFELELSRDEIERCISPWDRRVLPEFGIEDDLG